MWTDFSFTCFFHLHSWAATCSTVDSWKLVCNWSCCASIVSHLSAVRLLMTAFQQSAEQRKIAVHEEYHCRFLFLSLTWNLLHDRVRCVCVCGHGRVRVCVHFSSLNALQDSFKWLQKKTVLREWKTSLSFIKGWFLDSYRNSLGLFNNLRCTITLFFICFHVS